MQSLVLPLYIVNKLFYWLQATISLHAIVACGVSLQNAAHASHPARPAAAVRYRTWANGYLLIASATAQADSLAVFHTAVSGGLSD